MFDPSLDNMDGGSRSGALSYYYSRKRSIGPSPITEPTDLLMGRVGCMGRVDVALSKVHYTLIHVKVDVTA